uniref:Protein kinase domain-containing protein n=1 Tax=Panagrolaimus sp. PS1159 TaxID=55785 RepID=A0AC35G6D0_9BILA
MKFIGSEKLICVEKEKLVAAQTLRDKLLTFVSASITSVQTDKRDPWPIDPKQYIKGEVLSRGNFGIVKAADCFDSTFGFLGNDSRRCVVKTIYYRKRLEAILAVNVYNENPNTLSTDEKLKRFFRRTFMEVYVLTRCRHENLIHAHAVFFSDSDLYIILPRFYVLHDLIEVYRERYGAEPIPVAIIARILRQICLGLQFLQRIGIMHRDVQPDNILLTRNGTVKLGHFAQSRALLDSINNTCITPVGKEEFMAFEKLFNLEVSSKSSCLSYSYSADIWSLGVLVLQMTTYFPNEQFHKLPKNFAALMHEDRMPFAWFTSNMMQLRSRLSQSGGEELKSFISEKLLVVDDKRRPSPSELLNTKEMRKWCSPKLEDDKVYLRKKFIDDLDFANQYKLEAEGSNYDFLESKDIPAEFYWDDSWKNLDEQNFIIEIETFDQTKISSEFLWGAPAPLFSIFYPLIESEVIELSDLLLIEPAVDNLAFGLIEEMKSVKNRALFKEVTVALPPLIFVPNRFIKIILKITHSKRRDSLGWSTDSDSDNGDGLEELIN